MRSLVSISDLSDQEILHVLDRAAAMEEGQTRHRDLLTGRIVCTAFFEPSTRTRLSFESAAHRLGGDVIGFTDGLMTSASKGESLADTARVLSGYADVLVLRHGDVGAAKVARDAAHVPVINAGDGAGEHPTQTLVDLYTMRAEYGRLDGLRVALVGDLRYGRTVHSLLPALQRLGAEPVAVPARGLELPEHLGRDVEESGLREAARTCDVLYVTRVQKERFMKGDIEAVASLRVDRRMLEDTGSKAIVLHPLPRVDELDPDVDGLPSAKYFDQAHHGVAVRMAVLASVVGAS